MFEAHVGVKFQLNTGGDSRNRFAAPRISVIPTYYIAGYSNLLNIAETLVRYLGCVLPSTEQLARARSTIESNTSLSVSALYDVAVLQKVVVQVYVNLCKINASGTNLSIASQFIQNYEHVIIRKRTRAAYLNGELERFSKSHLSNGIIYAVTKGGCVGLLYPTESFRDMVDIDIVISSEHSWLALKSFCKLGYRTNRIRIESYPFSTHSRSTDYACAALSGIAELYCEDPNEFPFDLHFGGFPGCGDAILEIDLWSRLIPVAIGSTQVLMPSIEDCILIICSHVARHGHATLRDLNDLEIAVRNQSKALDWDYIMTAAQTNSINTILTTMLSMLIEERSIGLPESVLNAVAAEKFLNLRKSCLFNTGRFNKRFHGHRQLLVSRLLQLLTLYSYYSRRIGVKAAVKESFVASYYLLKTGRPFKLWRRRQIQSLEHNRRIVVVPLFNCKEDMIWLPVHFNKAKISKAAQKLNVDHKFIGDDTLIWGVGDPYEILITPSNIYTQSAYGGYVAADLLVQLQDYAMNVMSELKIEEGFDSPDAVTPVHH